MAECMPRDDPIRKERRDDSCGFESGGTDRPSTAFATRTKDNEKKRWRKGNHFQALDGENTDETDIRISARCTPVQNEEEAVRGSLNTKSDESPAEIKSGKKRRRIKNILFWRKTKSHKSKASALSSEGSNIDSELPTGTSAAEEPQSEALSSPSFPKTSTAEPMEQIDQYRNDARREYRRMAPPKNTKMQEVDEKKHFPWWHPNLVFRKYHKTKATYPRDKEAVVDKPEDSLKNLATQEAASCSAAEVQVDDDLEDVLNPAIDHEHTCAICYDVLVKPHAVRPCGHIFCEACLRQLQQASASRSAQRGLRGRRPAFADWDVLVLCPVCRGPIRKCNAKEELNEIIHSKYPRRYQERYKQMQEETDKLKHSKLPSSTYIPFRRPKRVAFPEQPVQGPIQRLKTILDTIRSFAWSIVMCVAWSIVITYLICVVITVGHLKFCLALVNKTHWLFEPRRGEHRSVPIFNLTRAFSVVFIFIAIKLFYALHWGQLFCLTISTLFITIMGYVLTGRPEKNIALVVASAIVYPIRNW